MGLDQYLFKVKTDLTAEQIQKRLRSIERNEEFSDEKISQEKCDFLDSIGYSEIGYWRKHPNLHGYCEDLWYHRGGDGDFNCDYLELTKEDVLEIIKLSKQNQLPQTTGFFFGKSTNEDNEHTIETMEKALEYIHDGYKILYYAWW